MIVRAMGQQNWSEEERAFLRKHHKTMTDQEIADALGKDAESVKNQMRHLLLDRNDSPKYHDHEIRQMAKQGFTASEIAADFGFSIYKITHYCQKNCITLTKRTAKTPDNATK